MTSCSFLVGNDTSRVLVGIASSASVLIEYKYGHTIGQTPEDYCTLSPNIRALGNYYQIIKSFTRTTIL